MKISEVFERDIKREYSDIAIVDHRNKAADIYEYVVTDNIEDILGCFLAYFFDSDKFPKYAPKARLVKKNYTNEIGTGLWLSGPFGVGKSQMLKIICVLFTLGSIDYSDEKGNRLSLNIVNTLKEKLRNKEIADLLDCIKSFEYITLIFSANQLRQNGETIVDYLPKAVSKQLFWGVNIAKRYSVSEAAELLNNAIHNSGKKRMIIFIDNILDALDTEDKVRDFNALLSLLHEDIWFVVSSIEGKEKIDSNAGKTIIKKFGKEQVLSAQDMACIVTERYLLKNKEGKAEIEKSVNLASLQGSFNGTKLDINNAVAAYPFYPCQISCMTKLLGEADEASEINLMKAIKAIITNSQVYDKALGYFVDSELIYQQLQSKLSEFSKTISDLENEQLDTAIERKLLLRIVKAVILLAQVNAKPVRASQILPFVYNAEGINNDETKLQEALTFLASANFIGNTGFLYTINANYPEKADLPVIEEIEGLAIQSPAVMTETEEKPAAFEQSEVITKSSEDSKPVKETTIEASAKVVEEPTEAKAQPKPVKAAPITIEFDNQNVVTEEKAVAPQQSKKQEINYPKPSQPKPALDDASHIILNPKYTFNTFVVGNSNRFAHAVAQAVANSPGEVYNPLFIYGGVGLGKTHLMHAIGHRILQNHPDLKVVYISTEKFTNELIDALRDGNPESFRQKYRNIDVLMVDDIQFLSKQEHAQEEFFHTFNTLHEANKQIVISSDRPPREMQTLEDRLRSRFQMGLITDIQSPDIETRIAILQKKALWENMTVPNDVMFYIASHIEHNIRELEGALNRVMAFATVTAQSIDINLATAVLKDILPTSSSKEIPKNGAQEAVAVPRNSSINNGPDAPKQTTNNYRNEASEEKTTPPKKKSMSETGYAMRGPIRFRSTLEEQEDVYSAAKDKGSANQETAAAKSSDKNSKSNESGLFTKFFRN